jgi:hypothetical protein
LSDNLSNPIFSLLIRASSDNQEVLGIDIVHAVEFSRIGCTWESVSLLASRALLFRNSYPRHKTKACKGFGIHPGFCALEPEF